VIVFFSATYVTMNKGGCPRFPTRVKMMICQMRVSIDLAGVLCSGMLHRRTPLGNSCLEIVGSARIRSSVPVFLLLWFGFRGAC
jgi:hypothetical protein